MATITLTGPPADILNFPHATLRAGHTVYRVTQAVNGVWWFSGDGSGRFDLTPPSTGGTCYFGVDAAAGLCETFRTLPVLQADIDSRRVNSVDLRSEKVLADTTKPRARAFGVTKELVTVTPYDIPQAWARTFNEDDFDGILHELRHDLRPRATGISLFGPVGAADPALWELASTQRAITDNDLAKAGLRVRPRPAARGLAVK